MANRTCIIHIGMHKTGTSSIQNTLFENMALLREHHDIDYFDYAANHGWLVAAFHENLENFLALKYAGCETPLKGAAFGRGLLARLERAIEQNRASRFVLSAEDFSLFEEGAVERLKKFLSPHFDELTIHIYVREPFGFANSMAQQLLRGGATFEHINNCTLELQETGFARLVGGSALPQYRFRIEKFQNSFGRDKVFIKAFDKKSFHQKDIVFDFAFDALGMKGGDLGFVSRFDNNSLGADSAALLERLNKEIPLVEKGMINARRANGMFEKLQKLSAGEQFFFEAFDWRKYARIIAGDVAWLKEQTAGRIDFPLTPPEPPRLPLSTTRYHEDPGFILALNDEMLGQEHQTIRMQLFRELWRISLGDIDEMDNLERIIGRCCEPAFLLNTAHNLMRMKLLDQALMAFDRAISLASSGVDAKLCERAKKGRAALRKRIYLEQL